MRADLSCCFPKNISIFRYILKIISVAPSGKLVKNPPPRINKYQKSAMITRSSSTGVLNQSDSENETEKKRQSRLMRPTISSQNKITNNNKSMLNRKRQSHSTSKFDFFWGGIDAFFSTNLHFFLQ